MVSSSGSNDVYVIKLDPSGNTVWMRSFGGPISEGISAIEARNGQVYLVGTFYSNVDFDQGPGSFIMSDPEIAGDGYLVNWTSDGNFVWANSIGESSADGASSVQRMSDGTLVVGGYFTGTVDFDPGPGVFEMTSVSGPNTPNLYVGKYTGSGAFLWSKMWSSPSFIGLTGIRRTAQDGFVFCGTFNGSFYADAGPGVSMLTSTGSQSAFAGQFNSDGNWEWSGLLAGPSFVSCQAMDAGSGAVIMSGQFAPNPNFSINGDPLTLTTDGTSNAYIACIGVLAPCVFSLETSITPVFCNPTGGSATVTAGPPGSYTYLWNDPMAQTAATATGLTEGSYSVSVSDGTCTLTAIAEVTLFSGCTGDFNNDGVIGMGDFTLLVSGYGSNVCLFDLNVNGQVDFSDLSIFFASFGLVCP